MKMIKCELCGSNQLVKSGYMYTCQHCGTKYTPEEAKKLIIEGTVDVSGSTVKIDNDSYVKRYIENARRAKSKEDWEETEKYYNMVEQNQPNNIEAIFYSAYAKARLSMIENDIYKRQQICGVFCNSISIIDDNYDVNKSSENQNIIQNMHKDLFSMYGTNFVYTQRKNGYGIETSNNRNETYYLFAKMALAFIESLTNILAVDNQLIYLKMIYQQRKYLIGNEGLAAEAQEENRYLAFEIAEQIKNLDPNFEVDIPNVEATPTTSALGCALLMVCAFVFILVLLWLMQGNATT